MDKMDRLQFYLETELHQELEKLAKTQNVSKAEVIRESLRDYITKTKKEHNPALDIIGLISTKETNLAKNHDEHIYHTDWSESND